MLRKMSVLCITILFILTLGGCSEMFISDEFRQIMEQESMPLQELWTIEDENEFVYNMSMYIAEKCDYGSNFDALSHAEQVFYITQTLEMEVNNGGFWQFLYNVDEEIFTNTISAYSEIGAEKTAELCQKAFSAFGKELPESRSARIQFLSELGV